MLLGARDRGHPDGALFVKRTVVQRQLLDRGVLEQPQSKTNQASIHVLVERAESIDCFPRDSQSPLDPKILREYHHDDGVVASPRNEPGRGCPGG